MLIQSGSGKVYAVLANNTEFELSLMPTLALQSTTVFLDLRCRYKSLLSDYFDPMLAPKQVLVGGIERSQNTLRGHMVLNTGFTLDKIGTGFPDIVAQKVYDTCAGFLIGTEADTQECLTVKDRRDDFTHDFAQLVTSAIAPVHPAKDFSGASPLMNPFDLMIYTQTTATQPKSPFAAVPGGKDDTGAPVHTLVPKGGDFEPEAPNTLEKQGIDSSADPEPILGDKVHVIGQAPEEDSEPTDH